MLVKLGTTIPLYVILNSNDATKIVKCEIIEPRAPAKVATDITLIAVTGSPGHYQDSSVIMPSNANLIASFKVFESDGVTLYGAMTQEITLNQASDAASLVASNQSYSNLSALVDDGSLRATVSVEEA